MCAQIINTVSVTRPECAAALGTLHSLHVCRKAGFVVSQNLEMSTSLHSIWALQPPPDTCHLFFFSKRLLMQLL